MCIIRSRGVFQQIPETTKRREKAQLCARAQCVPYGLSFSGLARHGGNFTQPTHFCILTFAANVHRMPLFVGVTLFDIITKGRAFGNIFHIKFHHQNKTAFSAPVSDKLTFESVDLKCRRDRQHIINKLFLKFVFTVWSCFNI